MSEAKQKNIIHGVHRVTQRKNKQKETHSASICVTPRTKEMSEANNIPQRHPRTKNERSEYESINKKKVLRVTPRSPWIKRKNSAPLSELRG